MEMEKLKEALHFICSSDFLRMALFWNFALLSSYFQLLKGRIFGSKSTTSFSSSSSMNTSSSSHKPVCVITGVSHFSLSSPNVTLRPHTVWCNVLTTIKLINRLLRVLVRQLLLLFQGKASTSFLVNKKLLLSLRSNIVLFCDSYLKCIVQYISRG